MQTACHTRAIATVGSILGGEITAANSCSDKAGKCFRKKIYEPPHAKTNNLHRRKQRRSFCEADQCLCFRYSDSRIPLLSKSKISSLSPSSLTVQPSLCRTRSEPKLLVFLTHRLILFEFLCLLHKKLLQHAV